MGVYKKTATIVSRMNLADESREIIASYICSADIWRRLRVQTWVSTMIAPSFGSMPGQTQNDKKKGFYKCLIWMLMYEEEMGRYKQ